MRDWSDAFRRSGGRLLPNAGGCGTAASARAAQEASRSLEDSYSRCSSETQRGNVATEEMASLRFPLPPFSFDKPVLNSPACTLARGGHWGLSSSHTWSRGSDQTQDNAEKTLHHRQPRFYFQILRTAVLAVVPCLGRSRTGGEARGLAARPRNTSALCPWRVPSAPSLRPPGRAAAWLAAAPPPPCRLVAAVWLLARGTPSRRRFAARALPAGTSAASRQPHSRRIASPRPFRRHQLRLAPVLRCRSF